MKIALELRRFTAVLVLALLVAACTLQPTDTGAIGAGDVEVPPELALPPDVEVASDYIVQAGSVAEAAKAVRSVGGIVTHELSIIQAVGASLDSAQLAALRNHEAIRHVYEDAPVTTSSSCGLAAGPSLFEDSKVYWSNTNNGSSTVTIGSLSDAWPSVNSTLEKIKLGGDDIWNVRASGHQLPGRSGMTTPLFDIGVM